MPPGHVVAALAGSQHAQCRVPPPTAYQIHRWPSHPIHRCMRRCSTLPQSLRSSCVDTWTLRMSGMPLCKVHTCSLPCITRGLVALPLKSALLARLWEGGVGAGRVSRRRVGNITPHLLQTPSRALVSRWVGAANDGPHLCGKRSHRSHTIRTSYLVGPLPFSSLHRSHTTARIPIHIDRRRHHPMIITATSRPATATQGVCLPPRHCIAKERMRSKDDGSSETHAALASGRWHP